MKTHDLIKEMKLLDRCLAFYEEKYGISSEDFYNDLMAGKLTRYDSDESNVDFSQWKKIYETWVRRLKALNE